MKCVLTGTVINVLAFSILFMHVCFASSAKIQFASKIDSIDKTQDVLDTIYQNSDLDVVIEHHLQKHFELTGNTIHIGPASSEMAATFNDPSRALYRHTSISMDNDQANGIIYRGLPSHSTKWSVYGAEIVNPNHLSNAGTFSDQASTSAGGVLAIPFDVVRRFDFNASPQDIDDLNAISGNLDFDFNKESKRFFKIGLLGFEASYQGRGQSKIKVHGRYSTVGLLSDLGVDFDGESIDFQDLFFQMNLSDKLQFFSIFGSSNNIKESFTDSTQIETIKDIQNIEFHSRLSIQGLRLIQDNSSHTLIFSYKKDNWDSEVPDVFQAFSYTDASTSQQNTILTYRGDFSFGQTIDNGQFKLTLNAAYNQNKSDVIERNYDDSFLALEPSLSWSKYVKKPGGMRLKFGLGASYDTHSSRAYLNPSVSIQWGFKNQLLDVASAYISHRQNPLILNDGNAGGSNDMAYIKPSRSWSSAIGWKLLIPDNHISLLIRLFNTELTHLPISINYSPVINNISYDDKRKLNENGRARTYGVEFIADKNISDNTYLNLNASFFQTKFESENGTSLNSQFNFGHVFNLNVSHKITNRKENIWACNIAGHFRGGAYSNGKVRPIEAQVQLGDYWRIDFRMEHRWKSSVLTLDIQNVLNRQNDAYIYFDEWTKTEKLKKQMGLIPVLSYKRHF